MKRIFFLLMIMVFFLTAMCAVAQTTSNEWTMSQAKKWFAEKEWLSGLQLKPHQTINKQEFARQYHINRIYWDKAFAFLKEHDLLKLANEKYPIDGENVFAIVTENPTKDFDSTQWESHRNYIDLHYVIAGEEKIGACSVTRLTVTKPYDASRDAINYSGAGEVYGAMPGIFFIFFPSDAHRPGITTGGNKADKKIVIKIRYAE